ncbi:transporter substrate-binding domain-containing protein [Variovorax sp. NFACC27]|uniref:transporter substrate-binding domain-containing protein n=1 Tax=unclassified Variovorax TaxID=663243 RepID=UPI00089B5C73|nr:amino acid ABC transporter substrate-binding protein, PAAT family [Variovorax sp. NFACC28]SEG70196.1 amino acid ABC transporter substrate-binding protein, PAAT family [Variovorax sp. NFACC29]SFC83102.1 amino acid ABC transporter substrate-binding protein, PAAT family [Variovorax sp. NFACC26]SFF98092.1 amino acid ABC transporter substrate-binding protein, PAAT family [Variovorax sp. NFACC27]
MSFSQHDVAALAPTGILRATINLGNPVLACQTGGQAPTGVSVDLARLLANQMGIKLELIMLDSAGKAVDAVTSAEADIGFFAIDPVRGKGIAFTDSYVRIEGCYLVRQQSTIQTHADVDRAGIRVGVGKGSAYDLYLTRTLQSAEIMRESTSLAVVDTFIAMGLDVAAGVRQQLEADARRLGGLRLLPERFMVIEQAMGLPKSRGALATSLLQQFVEDAKSSGFVSNSLRRHRIEGVSIASATSKA